VFFCIHLSVSSSVRRITQKVLVAVVNSVSDMVLLSTGLKSGVSGLLGVSGTLTFCRVVSRRFEFSFQLTLQFVLKINLLIRKIKLV